MLPAHRGHTRLLLAIILAFLGPGRVRVRIAMRRIDVLRVTIITPLTVFEGQERALVVQDVEYPPPRVEEETALHDRAVVEHVLTDGTVLNGAMFMHADQRVLDIVNDERGFIPFASFDGPLKVINKAMIAHITPIERVGNTGSTG